MYLSNTNVNHSAMLYTYIIEFSLATDNISERLKTFDKLLIKK